MFTNLALGCLVVWLLSAAAEATAATVEVMPGGGRMQLQVWSMRELKVRSVILQKYDYSCGSAAVATLLTYHYDTPTTEEVAFQAMFDHGNQVRIQKEGFSFLDMKRYLEAQGYPADGFEVSLDDLLKAGIPAIVLMVDNGYHHFVVVKGMRGNKVLLGDPAVGLRVVPREQFEASWPSRVVFVIHDSPARGEFNTARDWSVRPTSPLGRPLSADTLNNIVLLRPGGGFLMNRLFQSIRRMMQIVMLALLGLQSMAPVMASVRDTDFTTGTPVSESVLESMRGGFQMDSKGPVISFGIERNVFINGKLFSSTALNIPSMQRLFDRSGMKPFGDGSDMKPVAHHADPKLPDHQPSHQPNETFTFIQSGPGNSFDHDTPSLPPFMTVIQNSLDNRTIQSETVINATVEALTWARSLHLGNALSQANIGAVHH